MDRSFISGHWYANAYEQFETQTNDVEFFIKILRENTGDVPQNILEAACGSGRIAVPLARAGHTVTGFDSDPHMLLCCYRKMRGLPGIRCYRADAMTCDWGAGYDVVVMAGNILINIESDMDYQEAQRLFILKASAALKRGGHLLLDYDQHSEASAVRFFNRLGESGRLGVDAVYTDDLGTCGKFKNYGGVYDPVTRICTWSSHRELLTNSGEQIIETTYGYKHIPSYTQVCDWLSKAEFKISKTYRNYTHEALVADEPDYVKATIWAQRL